MQERRNTLSTSHHLKNLKQQQYDRNLIDFVIELIKINDHDTLAYIARTSGIPPQLRHKVWPTLLKYHPMCIAPNILSNIASWDPVLNSYHMIIEPTTNKSKIEESSKQSDENNQINTGSPRKGKVSKNISNDKIIESSNDNDDDDDDNDNDDDDDDDGNDNNGINEEDDIDDGDDSTIKGTDAELEHLIMHDLQKYFKLRTNPKTSPNSDAASLSNSQVNLIHCESDTLTIEHELEVIKILKDAIMNFTNKWSKVYKYESGLAWIAIGLAEWFPPTDLKTVDNDNDDDDDDGANIYDGPVVLSGKRHSHLTSQPVLPMTGSSPIDTDVTDSESIFSPSKSLKKNNNQQQQQPNSSIYTTSLSYLYKEYPLPGKLQDKLPKGNIFNFSELYERLLLVILHGPDCETATKNLNRDFPSKTSNLSNYFPVLSGGDLAFQIQLFFRVFASILPELYQPLNDESSLQQNSIKSSWLYWWIKCSGARSLQRQDRARIWDLLLGWRPKPNMDAINFFLNYNDYKKFNQIYHSSPIGLNENFLRSHSIDITFVKKLIKNDPFWLPDLDTIELGSKEFPYDYNVFKEFLVRNKYEQSYRSHSNNNGDENIEKSKPSSAESLMKSVTSSLSSLSIANSDTENTGNDDVEQNGVTKLLPFEYSYVHPHIQVIFIYIAVLQYNEFKLLEFEETEILEFLNNLPMFSKSDDLNFRNLYLSSEYNTDSNHYHVLSSRRKGTMTGKTEENNRKYSTVNSETGTGLTTRSTSSSLSTMSNTSATNTNSNIVYNHASNQNSHMMIEVGNDAKASNSFNDLLNIAGDIWRKWFWKELEEGVNNDL